MEDPELSQQADRIAREIGIPPCPDILARFAAEMGQPDPDLRKLAALAGTDAALSAALVKTVNSPFYGLSAKATSVKQALSILGLRAGANLLAGLMLRNAFPPGTNVLMKRFWESSARIAQTAATVAGRIDGIDAEAAHTFALFRDAGMAVMIGRFPQYGPVIDRLDMAPGAQVLVAEEHAFRFNHARVGYALARGWMLPEPMCLAILHHHAVDPSRGGRNAPAATDERLVAVGLLAEQIVALRAGQGLCADWRIGEAFALDVLGLDAEQVIELLQVPLLEAA